MSLTSSSSSTVAYPFACRTIPGRGRGLVTTRAIDAGEKVASFAAYAYTLFDDSKPGDSIL
jgi:hypothetical protein